jgi:hypothetical protein
MGLELCRIGSVDSDRVLLNDADSTIACVGCDPCFVNDWIIGLEFVSQDTNVHSLPQHETNAQLTQLKFVSIAVNGQRQNGQQDCLA